MPRTTTSPARRGSALSLTILVSVVITGLVMTMAWSAGVQASMTGSVTRLDKAFYAAESGAQRLAWYAKNNKMASLPSPLKGTVEGCDYSATWTTISGTTIRITSTASLGAVSYTCSMVVVPPSETLPTFSTGGDFDNKNIDIEGDMVTGGDYTNGGNGKLEGNLTYSGTATNLSRVYGDKTLASYIPLDVTSLLPKLKSYAVTPTLTGNQVNRTFDFTAISATRKVIYVEGDVVNPEFIGEGTLVVKGNVSSLDSFGTEDKPVNIVADGDISTSGGAKVFGTLYASGAWYRQKVTLVGLVYVNGISPSNSAASSMKMTQAPWFDPRLNEAGKTFAKFMNFTGPQP
jgi:hypothetical protein